MLIDVEFDRENHNLIPATTIGKRFYSFDVKSDLKNRTIMVMINQKNNHKKKLVIQTLSP